MKGLWGSTISSRQRLGLVCAYKRKWHLSLQYVLSCVRVEYFVEVRIGSSVWIRTELRFVLTACTGNTWGYNCEEQCNCQDDQETCDHVDGRYPSGCRSGYEGTGCNIGKTELKFINIYDKLICYYWSVNFGHWLAQIHLHQDFNKKRQGSSQEFLSRARHQRVSVVHNYQINVLRYVLESSTSSRYGSGLVYEYERK